MNISIYTKITLLLLALTTMMSNVAVATVIPRLKEFFDEKNIEFLSRLMLTAPSISIALLSPFIGIFIYKIGKKKSALFALILFSLSGSAGLWLNSLYAILFFRGLLGISISILMIVSTSLVGDYFTGDSRNRYMSLQNAFIAFGGIFFMAGGGLLSDISWRAPFSIYLIGLILFPFALFFIKDIKLGSSNISNEIQIPAKNIHIYFLAFLMMVLFFTLPTQVPFLIINHFKSSGTLTGFIISSAFLFNAFGSITFSILKKHYSYSDIYLIGLSIMALGFWGIGHINNVYLFFITSPTMGFGGGIMMTNVVAWLLSTTTLKTRVKASSFLTSSFFLGQFCSPIITMPLVFYFGAQGFFSAMGIFVICLVTIGIIYKKIRR